MSPYRPDPEKPPVPPVKEEPKSQEVPPPVLSAAPAPIVVRQMSELDSHIAERMKEQPATLEEAVSQAQVLEAKPRHRTAMPDSLQKYFYHETTNPGGKFIPRWVLKDKRAVDAAMNKGWLIFNRSYFPEAPRYLFGANGGIELGDTLLSFMPIKQALAIRQAPAKLSQERIKGQMTQTAPDTVLMSGNQHAQHLYQPELGPESAETTETRDF